MEALGKAFERLLRWFYPGILFIILLYLFMNPSFQKLVDVRGYPWTLIIGGIGVGAIIYLIQANIVDQILNAIAQAVRWIVRKKPEPNSTQEQRPEPLGCLKKIVKWWDVQADDIELPRIDEKRSNYMNYANSTYHATFITGWLPCIFYCIRENGSPLSNIEWWMILIFFIFFLIASLNLFARLSRVRY